MIVENVVIIVIILHFLRTLTKIDKEYIKKLNYSISYFIGNLLILIYFGGWLYFNFQNIKSSFIADYFILCLIGLSLYLRGLAYLCLYRGESKNMYFLFYRLSLLIMFLFLFTVGIIL